MSSESPDPRFDLQALGRMLVKAPTPDPPSDPAAAPKPPAQLDKGPRGLPRIDWSLTGHPELAPKLADTPDPEDWFPLPPADVVVITWTSAEWDALHYVFSNELAPLPEKPGDNGTWRDLWRPYRRDFYEVFPLLWSHKLIAAAQDRAAGVPAVSSGVMRWGSYTLVDVGGTRVLLYKSDLHLNQDGEGLPLRPMIRQIVQDAQPSLVLSIGTAGGVTDDQVLGDAMVTPAAVFHLSQEFGSASFNRKLLRSSYTPPETMVEAASKLLAVVPELPVRAPTSHFPAGTKLDPAPHTPGIRITDRPIITTDRFEFGTTTNKLGDVGCIVEMDDAVIAMEIDAINEREHSAVEYAFVRNVSDPVINGALPDELQIAWAVVTYQRQGLATSYNGAIATWALIAAKASA